MIAAKRRLVAAANGFRTGRCLSRYAIHRRRRNADVPLADDFRFTGPVASFDSAEGYRAMARVAGQAVTSFEVRRQFVDGDTVCSIIDWEMAIPGVGRMTSAAARSTTWSNAPVSVRMLRSTASSSALRRARGR